MGEDGDGTTAGTELPVDTEQYTGTLRTGGTIVLGADRLVVDRDDEPVVVDLDDVVEVSLQDIDWFLAVMSAALVGFGLLSLGRSVLLGGAFAVAGAVSLALTYRKRYALRIRVAGRADPLRCFPADPQTLRAELEQVLTD
ncbi:hypothetical protein BVU17_09880 [Haloarcula taiwanensis]|uniref:Uncharacterized protein n=1 Tax=Haloarcula taiwanensis TaxID=1932004 RepID=A0A2H4ZZA4_9EURY|nr:MULTISPECIES: hypothetical protein [Haloarcula]AUG47809.1 hypothetical protein BVU17_09880 [Haloarcula taiwanensis]RLM39116.1 hypothetical protein DVK01_00735 [Haloarcula sp. Atlit-120R]RLM47060.1 hypothetical protein DVK00_00735 [Haloarcula sp. Atlit-47R]RLM90574.1 hypothetical protein D3D01_16865 [Haloarcula sp. Atlit-7R]